jgi:D-aspartate ligase
MADYYGTIAAIRSLGRAGVPVHVAEPQWLAPGRWSRYATRTSRCPPIEDRPDRFLDWLVKAGEREPGRVLLPTNDETAWFFARHRETLDRHFRVGVPPFETVDRLLNKLRLACACAEVGMPVPPTWCAGSDDDVARLQRTARFPVLVKAQTQVFLQPHLKGLVAEEPATLPRRVADFVHSTRYGRPLLDHDPASVRPLVQAFADGASGVYGLSGFVDATGEHFVAIASRKVLQRPPKAGVGLCFEEAVVRPELAERLARLCRHVGFHGVFEAEFLEIEGRHLLIDFNPRFYGQMALDVDRGLDLPRLAYLDAMGDGPGVAELVAQARRNVAGSPPRVWCNSIHLRMHLALGRGSRAMSAREARRWRSWRQTHRGHVTDAVASEGDPGPALAEGVRTLWLLLLHPRALLREVRR